jgi:hypothetical protein
MEKIGAAPRGHGFAQDVRVKLGQGLTRDNLRAIAFVQEVHQGRILGATVEKVPAN